MKWRNKGHEFDEVGNYFKNVKNIYIYGAGNYGGELYEKLIKFGWIKAFIDVSKEKQDSGYMNCNVISPTEFYEVNPSDEILVIVAASSANTTEIMKKLLMRGYIESHNLFTYQRFMEFYLPIYKVYRHNYLELSEITFSVTDYCSMKCRDCSFLFPYTVNPEHHPLEKLNFSVNTFFDKVDYVERISIIGGEPFLYPYLGEYVKYILKTYSNQFGKIVIVTNGTVIPQTELLEILSGEKVFIEISDYSYNGFDNENKLIRLKQELENACINNYIIQHENWINFGFLELQKSTAADTEMIVVFDNCDTQCRGFNESHMIKCMPAEYVGRKIKNIKDDDQYCNFLTDNSNAKRMILEFELGFSQEGHLEMCRYCYGGARINTRYIKPAIQLVAK